MTTTHKTEEARYWNEEGGERWVEHIDHLETMLTRFSRHLEQAVDAAAGEKILDIGCGGGPTSAAYARAVGATGEVLGADISAPILKLANARFGAIPALKFVCADAATHAFPPGHFDVLTSRYGVMFFPERATAFANLAAAVRPGGRCRMLVWRGLEDNPWMGAPARAAFTVITPPEKAPPGTPGPFSLAEPAIFRQLLEDAGFTDIEHTAVDETIDLGTVDDALGWLTRMGPASRPLAEAGADERQRALAAMREVLLANTVDERVQFAGAAWLVSGSRQG